MQKFKCIIVEDEPLAAQVLEKYIGQVAFLELVEKCGDAVYAAEVLHTTPVDLVFLDIHLPKLKGLDFIKALQNPPQIIITSAYQEYALQGYEHNVLDYLLKPVEFNRFLMAVNKLGFSHEKKSRVASVTSAGAERQFLFFNVSRKRIKVFLDEILFIESLKEYIRISTPNKSILTKFPIGQIEEILAANNFIRVHRSYIVSKTRIDAYSATDVEVGGKQIPIGRMYKDQVFAALG